MAKWVDGQGKALRLRSRHMQKMQTIVAGGLGMPRGKKGSQAVRLEALEGSEKTARERLAPVSQSAKRWLDRLGESTGRGSALDRTPSGKKGMEELDILNPEEAPRFRAGFERDGERPDRQAERDAGSPSWASG